MGHPHTEGLGEVTGDPSQDGFVHLQRPGTFTKALSRALKTGWAQPRPCRQRQRDAGDHQDKPYLSGPHGGSGLTCPLSALLSTAHIMGGGQAGTPVQCAGGWGGVPEVLTQGEVLTDSLDNSTLQGERLRSEETEGLEFVKTVCSLT